MSTPDAGHHWSQMQYLHEVVTNPHIRVRGTHSYCSKAYNGGFEESVVRYLYGDAFSRASWEPAWPIDELHIGDYVCIAAEVVILMGGNHTHRTDWFSLYPFAENAVDAYRGKGDTVIGHGAWLGMRSMIMPGVTIGEGAVVAAQGVVTRDVPPYTIVAGSPATPVRTRFAPEIIERLLALDLPSWPETKAEELRPLLCASDIDALERAAHAWEAEV
ncbi:CatB-related O-acetyltransferase [Streptomyces sp. SID8352]|uniref:CatB-related O-acetyltransferase n=1 Tax=Streptomyces sp. SID8352 TaxID=2690338 RepID=UPI00136B2EBC|nr:CatB-related O-acetyltransferase [Streptomyces sp. SID8352]MYU22415.1 antibiotic acetyltransferase [Streptomyces sp. SID8352]